MRLAFLFGSLAVLAPKVAQAWGGLGHRTVAYLAEKHFTPTTARMVATLLANDRGWDLSDGATWPDKGIQRRRPETAQWHYIDAQDDPPRQCGLQWPRDCVKGDVPGCVVSAIAAQKGVLMNATANATETREALMFVMHFLGDVHQPLHTELLERGGNGIPTCFAGRCGEHVNLHSVWDTLIPSHMRGLLMYPSFNQHRRMVWDDAEEKLAAQLWAQELDDGHRRQPESTRFCHDIFDPVPCAMQWASEANVWVCEYVLAPGRAWIEENDLAGDYYEGAKPIVELMVTKAGVRLAAWLNALSKYREEKGLDIPFEEILDPVEMEL